MRPAEPPTLGAERIDLAVGRADVDAVVRDRRRRVERPRAAEPRLPRRVPELPPGPRRERVEATVVGADVDPPRCERGRALDLAARRERPERSAGPRGERIDASEPVADIDRAADDERRRLGRTDQPAPANAAVAHVQREHDSVRAGRRRVAGVADEGDDDEPAVDGGRGPAAPTGRAPPDRPAGARVESEEAAVERREVDTAIGDRRRELEERPAVEGPAAAVRRPELDAGGEAEAGSVEAVGGPGDGLVSSPRRRACGRRRRCVELDRRRAADVAALVVDVQDVAGSHAEEHHGAGRAAEQQPSHAVSLVGATARRSRHGHARARAAAARRFRSPAARPSGRPRRRGRLAAGPRRRVSAQRRPPRADRRSS